MFWSIFSKSGFCLITVCLFFIIPAFAYLNEANEGDAGPQASRDTLADRVLQAENLLSEHPDSAIVSVESVLPELSALPNDSLAARAFYVLGTGYYFKDYYNIAVDNYEKALDTSYSTVNKAFRSRVLNNLGVSHDLLRQHDDALQYYLEALALEKQTGGPADIADVYNNISLVYYAIDDYEAAMQALDEAEKLIRNQPDSPLHGLILQNRGIIHSALGQYERSINTTQEAILIFEEFGYHRNKIQSVLNLAIDYTDRNENLEQAKALISGAMDEAIEHDIPVQRAMMNIQLARIALREDDPAAALTFLDSARSIFDGLDDPYLSFPLDIFELRVDAYAQSGNAEGVNRAMKEYIAYTEERDLARRARAINELKTQLEFKENLAEVQQKTIELEQQKSRTTIFFALFIIMLLLSAGLLFGYRYREKKLEKIYRLNQQSRAKISLLKRLTTADHEHVLNHLTHAPSASAEQTLAYSSQEAGNSLPPDEIKSAKSGRYAAKTYPKEEAELRSGKPERAKRAVFEQLQALMHSEKIYLEKGLGLSDLSTRMGVSARIISASVKYYSGSSFNHFINDYRIGEAIKILEDKHQNYLSLDAVYINCGFTSKTTFYSAFNRITGMTPSEYRKISQRQNHAARRP
ncbi:MAG: tetratricopeptide repeat protein [Cyclonatronaceae bacterium]